MRQDCFNIYILLIQTFKTFVQVEISKVLHGSVVEGRHLVAQSFFANPQFSLQTPKISSTCFGDPNAPIGPKKPKKPTQEPPQKWFSFRKRDERG